MMNKFFPVLLLFLMGSLSAQNFVVTKSPAGQMPVTTSVQDTINVLAIMVSFQTDRDGATFGSGKFGSIYSTDYGNSILDPLPHDKQYFEDHLLFTQNYFKNVSGDKLIINYFVLPDTFSVSQTMRNYAPEPGSDDFTTLGNFAQEAWIIAAQMYPGFNFEAYNLFTIFHAGVGRDISLPGSIGNERDLPSVYLSPSSFKTIFGSDFEGISLPGTDFKIPNTMIIPETESRELNAVNGTVLFEITINGLITASIGSYLGVPDLFDTETGLSAIGRFGLMDGQGIFAFSGTFPPEPSPWTKIRLGWVEPKVVELENADISLVTRVTAGIDDTVILKIPINSSEYYLVENRNRDANNDGSKVTYKSDGVIYTKTFLSDTAGYQSFDVESLLGVIIDVDEYDWAIPGNGILIWHIDENIINDNISTNTINTDKNNRGVDIEEADGIQDIGETFISVFGDEVIGEGTDEDLWHANNPGAFFENRFAKDTRPNSNSNADANSLITLKDFSDINNRMDFKVEFGDSVIKQIFSLEIPSAYDYTYLSSIEFNNEVYFFIGAFEEGTTNLIIATKDSIIDQIESFSRFKPAILIQDNILHVYGNGSDSKLNYWITNGTQVNTGSVLLSQNISYPIVANTMSIPHPEILFGTYRGNIFTYSIGGLPDLQPTVMDSVQLGEQYEINGLVCYGDFYAAVSGNENGYETEGEPYYFSSSGNHNLDGENPKNLLLTKDQNGNLVSIVYTAENNFQIISNGERINLFNVPLEEFNNNIALGDLKKDGNIYLVLNEKTEYSAYNLSGSLLDNFPVPDHTGYFSPRVADIEGNNNAELIFFQQGIVAFDAGTGKIINGFPFAATSSVAPTLFVMNNKIHLAIVSMMAGENSFSLNAWSISSAVGNIYWSEEYGNSQNNSFVDAAENTNSINEFFPTNRAYNYPNPVYDGETFIRYYVSEDSRINIKIFDLAGDYVAELNDEAQGGMDNETTWNVSDIQSGVYLARIEATGSSGQSEFAIIKIAVVK